MECVTGKKKMQFLFSSLKKLLTCVLLCTLIASIGFTFAEKGKHLIRRKKKGET